MITDDDKTTVATFAGATDNMKAVIVLWPGKPYKENDILISSRKKERHS
jgi:hypothetical protein